MAIGPDAVVEIMTRGSMAAEGFCLPSDKQTLWLKISSRHAQFRGGGECVLADKDNSMVALVLNASVLLN